MYVLALEGHEELGSNCRERTELKGLEHMEALMCSQVHIPILPPTSGS